MSKAQNSFVGVEHLTDKELEDIRAGAKAAKAEAVRRAGGSTKNGKAGPAEP